MNSRVSNSDANFRQRNFDKLYYQGETNFDGMNLSNLDLSHRNLCGCSFYGVDFTDTNLIAANLNRTDLRRAILCGANLSNVTLCNSNFDGAKLHYGAVGSRGYILCALTGKEWLVVQHMRGELPGQNKEEISQ